jgi:doxX family protein
MLLLHGIFKVANGFSGLKGMLAGMGMPKFFAYGALVGEVVAPVLLIIGLLTRPAAAVVAFNMLVAVAMAHSAAIFSLTPMGGWAIELPMLFFFPAVALIFTGGGKYIISSHTCLD